MSNLLGVAAAIQTQADSLHTPAQSFALQRALWRFINYLRKMWLDERERGWSPVRTHNLSVFPLPHGWGGGGGPSGSRGLGPR